MAIEMSLQNSPNPVAMNEDSTSLGTATSFGELSSDAVINPFACTDEYSTVVTRVPNKSVEDLNREVMGSERSLPDQLGACGGLPDLANQRSPFGSHDFHYGGVGTGKPNQFGVIKDLSANNLFATDSNKTKDFEKKDFSQIYVKSNLPDLSAMEEKVFEPRPPYPPEEEHSLARKLHLGLSGSEDEEESKEQVWQERKPSTGSDRSFCSSPNIAHSPRENHTRFPVDHALSTLPDIIDTHLDRHRNAPTNTCAGGTHSSAEPYQSAGASYYQGSDHLVSAFDEDDPGPHLDAVLRSLSKLTARLGDQDDFFLGSLSSEMPPPPPPLSPPEMSNPSGINGLNSSEQCHSDYVNRHISRPLEGQGQESEETDEQFYDADSTIHRQLTPPPPPLTFELDEIESEGQIHADSAGTVQVQPEEEDQEGAVYV